MDGPTAAETDVVILGGGPAGYACALRAADLGLQVTVVEADRLGGTCLHHGCVPTRAMLHAAAMADTAARLAPKWGIASSVDAIHMGALLQARDHVVTTNHRAVERHLAGAGITVLRGKGWLTGRRSVLVDGASVTARRAIVLATGSRPRMLDGLQPDGRRVLTSDQALALDRVPASAVVLGGGAIGAELSQVWQALGADVTLLEREPGLVPGEDPEIGRELTRALRRRGIKVVADATVSDVTLTADGVHFVATAAGQPLPLSAEVLLLAIGRSANTAGLGLDDVGVDVADGFVGIADWSSLQTTVQGIYAVGDLVGPPSQMRANTAYAEGRLVAEHIAGLPTTGVDYRTIPRVTHGITETAAVGFSEPAARAAGWDVEAVTLPLGAVAKGAMHAEGGIAKVIRRRGGPIVGVALVGPHVTELIGESMLMTGFEALPSDVAPLVHAHPTLSEVLSEAVMALDGRPLHWRS